jgi:hypothetical protein
MPSFFLTALCQLNRGRRPGAWRCAPLSEAQAYVRRRGPSGTARTSLRADVAEGGIARVLSGASVRGSLGGGEGSRPEEILMVIDCLGCLLPQDYPAEPMVAGDGGERHPCGREQAHACGQGRPRASRRPCQDGYSERLQTAPIPRSRGGHHYLFLLGVGHFIQTRAFPRRPIGATPHHRLGSEKVG